MKKVIGIAVILAVLVGIVIWKITAESGFYYSGTIEATEIDISSRLSSIVSSYAVSEGDFVKEGQTLVNLDSEDIKLGYDIAQKDYDRALQLLKSGSIPQEAYDKIKYRRDDASMKLSWCRINSPINGKVLAVYHENGEWVAPGTKLLTVGDLTKVWAYIYVVQETAAKLSVGTQVKGIISEIDNRSYSGKIVHINDEAEFTPKNVQTRDERARLVYGVKILFPNTDNMLKPGMTIEVKLAD